MNNPTTSKVYSSQNPPKTRHEASTKLYDLRQWLIDADQKLIAAKRIIENSNIPFSDVEKQKKVEWRKGVIPTKIVVEAQITFLKSWLRQSGQKGGIQLTDGTWIDPSDPKSLLQGCRLVILELKAGDSPLEPYEEKMLGYLNAYLGPVSIGSKR